MFRKLLADLMEMAMEDPARREPIDLFDLQKFDQFEAHKRLTSERVDVNEAGKPESFTDQLGEEIRLRSRAPEDISGDEQRSARERPLAPVVTRSPTHEVSRAEVMQSLGSIEGVRRALVIQEILGPPRSLRAWDDD